MKNKTYTLNTLLALVLGAGLLTCVVLRAAAPQLIMPELDVPSLTAISLVTLVVDHYLAPGARRQYASIAGLSAVTFGLLPFAAMFATALDALRLAVLGCVVFTAAAWLFTSVQDRLSSGPAARFAPVMSALGIWLASQAFAGIL